MPQLNCNFSHEKVLAVFEAHGVEPVETYANGVVIWGTREIGKEFPVKFLATKQFEPGIWDIYTLRNLVQRLELDEEECDKIDAEIFGYRPADE